MCPMWGARLRDGSSCPFNVKCVETSKLFCNSTMLRKPRETFGDSATWMDGLVVDVERMQIFFLLFKVLWKNSFTIQLKSKRFIDV